MSTTDTPRTDACPHCGARNDGFELYACGTCLQYWDDEPQLAQSDLCRYYEMQLRAEKAEAEVERLRANLRRAIEIAEEMPYAVFNSAFIIKDLRAELDQLKATINQDNK